MTTAIRDIVYAEPDGATLRVDLFLPDVTQRPAPLVVWLHAGGWRFGDRRFAPDLSRFFAAQGLAVAAIDYRLSTQAVFPAQIEDVKTAIRWLRAHAATYGFDPARIGLLGSSAGGHLAALAALTADGQFVPPGAAHAAIPGAVQAVVVGYAPTDFLQIDAHRPPDDEACADEETLRLPRGVTRSAAADSFESLLVGGPIAEHRDRVREANPLTYVHPGAPPFLILHGAGDTTVPVHQSELLYDALARHDNDVALWVIDRLGHGFLQRSHLDDRGPWRMTGRTHRHGGCEQTVATTGAIFPAIHAFFVTAFGAPPVPR